MTLKNLGEGLKIIGGLVALVVVVGFLIRFGPFLDRLEHRLDALITLVFVLSLPFVAVGSWIESRRKKRERALEVESHKRWMASQANRVKE